MGLGRRKPDSTLEAKEILSTVETESRKIDPRFADVRTSCTTVSTSELLRSPSPRMRSPSARPIPKYSPNVAGVPDGDEHTARAAENTPILLARAADSRRVDDRHQFFEMIQNSAVVDHKVISALISSANES